MRANNRLTGDPTPLLRFHPLMGLAGPGVLDEPTFRDNQPAFAVACGLALQGLSKSWLRFNLTRPAGWLARAKSYLAGPPRSAWGIDLGKAGLKAIHLELRDGQVVATSFDHITYPATPTEGNSDPGGYPGRALTSFLARNKLRHARVAISVPGSRALVRCVRFPPVEERMFGELATFEARQTVPFSLDEVAWDWQKLRGEVSGGVELGPEVGLVAIKQTTLEEALAPFQAVSVPLDVVQLAPLALVNFLALQVPTNREDLTYCGLDVGACYSSLVLTDGRQRLWQRALPMAGNDFTRALASALGLSFTEAEQVKCSAAGASTPNRICRALEPVLQEFVSEVRGVLNFFRRAHPETALAGVIGLGNGFRVPGLQRLLAEKVRLPVLWGEQTVSP